MQFAFFGFMSMWLLISAYGAARERQPVLTFVFLIAAALNAAALGFRIDEALAP